MDAMKEAVIEAIRRLPEGCSSEEMMYQIYFVSQVMEGLNDAEQGRVLSSQEVLERIEKWSK
ncbi:hypothetical protein [Candidatus Desulforudis audaxviator]|nr:hypothetical protein [Candidatus Desulforudis audaxviator]AZK60243.1 hypothetical protein Daudx_1700 [Candidatus Desulforudis audaxviator]